MTHFRIYSKISLLYYYKGGIFMRKCFSNFKKIVLCLVFSLLLSGIIPSLLELPNSPSVANAASVRLSNSKVTLIAKQSITLKLNGTAKKVSWSSSSKSIATVNSRGKVTANRKGTATITAKVSSKKYSCKVIVETPTISKTSTVLSKGSSTTLKINGNSQKVKWTSTNKRVATVSSKGKVSAKGTGTATVIGAIGNKKYSCKVTVKNSVINVKSIKLNNSKASLAEGKTLKLTVSFTPSNATNKKVSWSSSNNSVAKVSNGQVTALKKGSAKITARSGKAVAVCQISVTSPIITVQAPKYAVAVPSDTDVNCLLIPMAVQNRGTQTLRIYNNGARLSDDDYYYYDRDVRLFDADTYISTGRMVYLDYIDLKAGQTKKIGWMVLGNRTWYDSDTEMIFNFKYTGVMYKNVTSNSGGSTYLKF